MANLSALINSLNSGSGIGSSIVSGLLLPRQYSVAGQRAVGVQQTANAGGSASVKLSDYGKLQAGLSSLRDAAGRVDSADKVAKLLVKSSSDKITAEQTNDGQAAQAASVQVSQLAQSQVVLSAVLGTSEGQSVGTGSLTIQFGNYNASTNTFTASQQPGASVTIGVLDASVGGVASAINRAGVGVTASVVQDSGGNLRLQLSGSQTGANQAFSVSVNDADGNNTDNVQGLSRLAYNPTAAADAGRNLTAVQVAQDAQLTVNGRPFSTSSNITSTAVSGITLTAGSTGVAQITLSRDGAAGLKSAQAFVNAYNQFRDQLGSVSADGLTRQIGSSLGSAVSGADSGTGQTHLTLAQIGITQDSDGKLKLDQAKFNTAFAASPDAAANLVANAAQRTGAAADSTLNGSLRSATNALQASAATTTTNPFVAQALQVQAQSFAGTVPSLLNYSPTTQNLYGLAQYLAVSGL